jgi:hypothetical protein
LFSVKNANFFAEFFGENISKIITSVPDLFVPNHRLESARKEADTLPAVEMSFIDLQWLQVILLVEQSSVIDYTHHPPPQKIPEMILSLVFSILYYKGIKTQL